MNTEIDKSPFYRGHFSSRWIARFYENDTFSPGKMMIFRGSIFFGGHHSSLHRPYVTFWSYIAQNYTIAFSTIYSNEACDKSENFGQGKGNVGKPEESRLLSLPRRVRSGLRTRGRVSIYLLNFLVCIQNRLFNSFKVYINLRNSCTVGHFQNSFLLH